jgi:hypothetical protein
LKEQTESRALIFILILKCANSRQAHLALMLMPMLTWKILVHELLLFLLTSIERPDLQAAGKASPT